MTKFIVPSLAITDSLLELITFTVTPSESRSVYDFIFSIAKSAALFVTPYLADRALYSALNLFTIGVSLSTGAGGGVTSAFLLRVITFSNSSCLPSGVNFSVFGSYPSLDTLTVVFLFT